MPSSNVTLEGLPLSVLKQKAAYSQDPNASLADLIHQAHQVYSSAVQADSLDQTELAYVHYFKAAGLFLSIPDSPASKLKILPIIEFILRLPPRSWPLLREQSNLQRL